MMTNNQSEKTILSYRRYDNFYSFYKKLKVNHPYYIYPTLSKKNILTKIFTDEQFMLKRRMQLKYFLNYLYNHPKLKNVKEFNKFIKDPEFDEEFFKEDTQLLYPESQKYKSGSFYKVINSVSSIITTTTISGRGSLSSRHDEYNEKEIEFGKAKVFYKNLLNKLLDQMKSLFTYSNCVENMVTNYNDLSISLLYLKGRKGSCSNMKNQSASLSESQSQSQTKDMNSFFHHLSGLTKDLRQINDDYSKAYKNVLNDDFDNYILSINGVVEAFRRYEQFMKIYYIVHQANKDSKINTSYYDLNILQREVADVDNCKLYFEQTLEEELNTFIKENNQKYSAIMTNFTSLCCLLNINEYNKFNEYKAIIN